MLHPRQLILTPPFPKHNSYIVVHTVSFTRFHCTLCNVICLLLYAMVVNIYVVVPDEVIFVVGKIALHKCSLILLVSGHHCVIPPPLIILSRST